MAVTAGKLLVGVGSCVLNSINVGGTRGGLTFTSEREFLELDDIDQEIGTVEAKKTKERYTVKTELAEATLENIKAVLGLSTAIAEGPPRVLEFGGDADPSAVQLEIYGTAPNGYQRKVTLYKTKAIETGDVAFKKDELTVIPVTFLCIKDLTKDQGKQVGKIEDSTS